MYIHIDTDEYHRLVGGSISHPQKEPTSQIAQLVNTLSDGLNEALASDTAEIVPQEDASTKDD